MSVKPIIYQLIPRLFTNTNANCIPNGTLFQNKAGKMNRITNRILNEIKNLGITHIWYTGIIEHTHKADYSDAGIATDNPYVVKGQAGSPYAIKDYYDVDPDIATDIEHRIAEFRNLVNRTHKCGLKVIIDFVPNHVAREYHSDAKPIGVQDLGEHDDNTVSFAPNNNFYYLPGQKFAPHIDLGAGDKAYIEAPAKASGNDCFTASPGEYDWYDTVKLNYGIDYCNGTTHFNPIPDTWQKMLHILKYWVSMGVDGFRCDMAHMVPIEFWQWAIHQVKQESTNPIIFIAEIYNIALYRDFIHIGGFDYLYDKVNLYDSLRAIQCTNLPASHLTSCWQTVDGIGAHMLNFLENHDEQRFGSQFYAGNPLLVTPSLVVSAMIGTGPMMIYAGQELGEPGNDAEGYSGHDGRTTIFDYWSIPTIRRWFNRGKCDSALLSDDEIRLRNRYRKILSLCNTESAIANGAFFDLMYVNYDNPGINTNKQYAFLRSSETETLIIIVNFDAQPCSIRLNIPQHAFDILKIAKGEYSATELLSGEQAIKLLSHDTPFCAIVGAYDSVIWKVKHHRIDCDEKKLRK